MKQFIFLPLLLVFFTVNAQNSSITGQVSDAQTSESIEYASVAIYDANDSSLVTGVLTSQSGTFKLEKLNQGSYFLRTQFLGYETKQSENLVLNQGQHLQVGTISLTPGSQLMNEVSVTGKEGKGWQGQEPKADGPDGSGNGWQGQERSGWP